ncbi:MAG: hypothetical protein HOO86_08655 [Bacteroidales bacterium]|nr:hypothetical protein [Bacteroidales bacterium]
MNKNAIIDRIITRERLNPYLKHHSDIIDKALAHYKSNILVSESFYPLIAILEVGLRNTIDNQLNRKYNDSKWYENTDFIRTASRYQIDRISEARTNIQASKKEITTGRIISELTFGFWTSLFDTKFELTLWKNLRLAFPNCPKQNRNRKNISSKFNQIRKFRNRIFHHEAITWNLDVLNSYNNEILEGISWLDNDLLNWIGDLNHVGETIEKYRKTIE